jgi:hypothetical protein
MKLKDRIKRYLRADWNVGLVTTGLQDTLHGDKLNIVWLKHHYKDRFFADPFILKITETDIILLVEEFYFPINKGRIARLTINKNNFELKSSEVVLESNTHLSFPIIYRDGDTVYIYPENGHAGKLELYKYDEDLNAVSPITTLCDDPLADAVITTDFEKPYIFSTKLPYEISIGNVLDIYKSEKWDGVYTLDHSIQLSDKHARNAGNLFRFENRWIRPAQDCNIGYGKGLVLEEVFYENGRFSFREFKRFYPAAKKWNLGLHTFSISGDTIIVDGYQYLKPLLCKILIWGNNTRVKIKNTLYHVYYAVLPVTLEKNA